MTVVDNRPGESTGVLPLPAVRLPRLVGARRGWFTVLAPATGIDKPLSGATIWDPARPPGRHQLVLVPAPRPAAAELTEALETAARADAAALVVREGCLPRDFDVTAVAARAGVPVLAVGEQVGWEEIGTLVRALVSGARFGARSGAPTASGLYELAESAALALDGAVVLTDAGLRVLAFACPGTVDDLTTKTILARRVPVALRDQFAPMRTAAWIDVPGAGPRLVAPIPVGHVVGGYAVLAPGADTPDSAPRVLGDVAAAAAAWFIDEPAGRDDEDAVRAELLRRLLTGTGSLEALADRLDRPGTRRWCLMSLGAHAKTGGVTPDVERVLGRCARMLNPDASTAVLGAVAYVLFPAAPGPAAFAERLRQRAARAAGGPLVACLSRPLETSQDVRAECGLLRRAVDVLAARAEPVTGDLADLRPHVLIAEVAGLATDHPQLLHGALDVLRHDDSPRGAEYLDTLLSWFDAGCDATRAAAALRVHRNTFRYRLQRIEKLCAIDLDDAVQRFTLELQVRLLVLRGGW
ncbi:helix-turn-helix domain-containing protein [Amycolatopsis ruanii]|uniref:helix-turn-helix domain-containing protein n=1 Tax=Amycolatopsis ruanii TaxID=944491 RepID=UPI000E21E9FD|nr:helix-turn-helix domain-containing protein [Amycolatopsis ruanii]